MAQRIHWLYERKSCNTCKKAKGFLEHAGVEVLETADANKQKFSGDDALKLLSGLETLIAIKGKKVQHVDLTQSPDEASLLTLLLGPTGNLRAPTARLGKTLVVGFNEEAYSELFSS